MEKNPLSGMDPISQYEELQTNIKELSDNMIIILNTLKPVVKNTLSLPCQISKNFTDNICGISDKFNNTFDSLSNKNPIEIIQHIANKSVLNTQNINKLLENKIKKINDLKQETKPTIETKPQNPITPKSTTITPVHNEKNIMKLHYKNNIQPTENIQETKSIMPIYTNPTIPQKTITKLQTKPNPTMPQKTITKLQTKPNIQSPKFKSKKILRGGGNDYYNYIINPKTNRKNSIFSKKGQQILKNYYNALNI